MDKRKYLDKRGIKISRRSFTKGDRRVKSYEGNFKRLVRKSY